MRGRIMPSPVLQSLLQPCQRLAHALSCAVVAACIVVLLWFGAVRAQGMSRSVCAGVAACSVAGVTAKSASLDGCPEAMPRSILESGLSGANVVRVPTCRPSAPMGTVEIHAGLVARLALPAAERLTLTDVPPPRGSGIVLRVGSQRGPPRLT